jgi:mannose-6-phosphate isomerase-like protein (cupin superfamily)
MPDRWKPTVIHAEESPFILASSGVPVKRLITKAKHGSEIILGICEMKPDEESIFWSSELNKKMDDLAKTPEKFKDRPDIVHYGAWHEVYYVVKGDLILRYGPSEAKMESLTLKGGDAVCLSPGWIYRIKNTGKENAFFVWAGTPPLS